MQVRHHPLHMATILELARHADVPAESVIRVVSGEPVNSQLAARVQEAIEVLGPPPYPYHAVEPRPVEASVELARRQLLESFTQTAAELESRLPEGVGSVVYEALRVEVRPVAQHVSQIEGLVEHLVRRLERLDAGVDSERRERLEDLKLLIELITTGWRTMDARLGRVELILQRLEASNGKGRQGPRHLRVDP
jgi:hypothetical protein